MTADFNNLLALMPKEEDQPFSHPKRVPWPTWMAEMRGKNNYFNDSLRTTFFVDAQVATPPKTLEELAEERRYQEDVCVTSHTSIHFAANFPCRGNRNYLKLVTDSSAIKTAKQMKDYDDVHRIKSGKHKGRKINIGNNMISIKLD